RISAEHIIHPSGEHQQSVDRNRQDAIQGNGGDDNVLTAPAQIRIDPVSDHADVRDTVRMEELPSFRNAGCTAGILKDGDVFQRTFGFREFTRLPFSYHVAEGKRLRQTVGRHHLLDVAHHEVYERPLEPAQHIPEFRYDNVTNLGIADNLFQ